MVNVRLGPAPKPKDVPEAAIDRLSAHIYSCWEEAKSHKQDLTERLLKCERQRRGEYDPDIRRVIADQGGSDVFMMLTDVKCRAAESWMKDVMMSSDRTWSMSPTSEPTIPEELRMGIIEMVTMEALEVQEQGMQLDPSVIGVRMSEVYDDVQKKIREYADESANRMMRKMDDVLQESDWANVMAQVIYDFTTYPFVVLKGPVLRRRRQLKWGKNWKPIVEEVAALEFDRVSPYDAFWSPNASTPQEGYFIERIKLTRSALSDLRGMPNVRDDAVVDALDSYGRGGLREFIYSDSERATLEGRSSMAAHATDLIEGISYWGSVSGELLREWGTKDVDPHRDYEVNVWMFGRYVVLCRLNPDPLGRRPYSKDCWEAIPGAFAGKALPELMRDVQAMCNAAARALATNMSVSSGPQVEVSVDRLAKGEEISELVPYRIWQTTSDRTGGGQSAIRFWQPEMNAETLMNVYMTFSRQADEVTGVPNYIYGSSAVGGAGRTASGLSMLMENAAKGIKNAILSLDRALVETLKRLYNHLMIYDKDPSIKADLQIVASGVVGTLMKDQIQARRAEFLASTLNPIDAQIITPDRRAYLLREQAKMLNVDPDKVVPTIEEVKSMMAKQEAAAKEQLLAQQAQEQEAMPPGGQ
jgi:hypothetical protein